MLRYLLAILLMPAIALAQVSDDTITSGVLATESARGTVARNMAKDLSEGSSEVEKVLYDSFMQVRVEIEKLLKQNGFASQDVGVAYGVYFVTLWEMANNKELSEQQEIKAVEYWTTHLHELNLNSKTLGTNKDQFYDLLMHTPIILASLKEAAIQTDNQELLAVLPEQASQLFTFITKYPASVVTITANGGMEADEQKMKDFLMTGNEEEVRRLLQADMSKSKIDAFLAKRGAPKNEASIGKKQKDIDSAVMDTYTSIIQTNTLMAFPNSW